MKHAWLIIAHNEFEILQLLISALDDSRNDIFVHIDKKVSCIPILHTEKSYLRLLPDRLDVRWGHSSQIECELLLLKEARLHAHYERYHIISGTHLPLKSKKEIFNYFDCNPDCELMHLWERDDRDISNKLKRYNFFVRYFASKHPFLRSVAHFCWTITQTIQKKLKIDRFPGEEFLKSDNWLSLTDRAVEYLIQQADTIRNKYRYTYCGDEYFVATELSSSFIPFTIVNTDKLLKADFVRYNPKVYTMNDADSLLASDCLFARKFSSEHLDIVHYIAKRDNS